MASGTAWISNTRGRWSGRRSPGSWTTCRRAASRSLDWQCRSTCPTCPTRSSIRALPGRTPPPTMRRPRDSLPCSKRILSSSTAFEVIRDPLWNNIRLEAEALAIIDTPAFQRLRYVRQLGHAFLVYPGATHTRFEHALGAYHLACRVTRELDVQLAALLHDIGHYPFSHALEEAGLPPHESLAARHLRSSALTATLAPLNVSADRLLELIQGTSKSS